MGGRTGQRAHRPYRFVGLTQLDSAAWHWGYEDTFSGLMARNRHALGNPDWLSNWLDYVRVRSQTESIGLGPLAAAVEAGRLRVTDIDAGYCLAVYDLLAREILKDTPALAAFSGNTQRALQGRFREYDIKLKDLQRKRIACKIAQRAVPAGKSVGPVGAWTDHALLRRECEKNTKHIPLRQLVKRAGNALVALKPCFMMGPMSVAQFLEPGQIEFDVVVMGEGRRYLDRVLKMISDYESVDTR